MPLMMTTTHTHSGNRIAQTKELIAVWARYLCAAVVVVIVVLETRSGRKYPCSAENSCSYERARHATNTTQNHQIQSERMNERQFIFAIEKMWNAFDFGFEWCAAAALWHQSSYTWNLRHCIDFRWCHSIGRARECERVRRVVICYDDIFAIFVRFDFSIPRKRSMYVQEPVS